MIEKHELLGLNRDGSMPARRPSMFQPNHAGEHPRVDPHPSFNHHGQDRTHEHVASQGARARVSPAVGSQSKATDCPNIARAGGKPKNHGAVPKAMGMHRTTGTNEAAPVTVALASIPDASNPCALDPTKIGKRLSPVRVHPAMTVRQRLETAIFGAPAHAVLREGLDCAGPDHPENMRGRT